ncbi:hypothetical protein DPMN_067195 [Dreissena polymorpha]|uniref:Fibrinogen C-terminal domain-containing protein n=1 Tax=Dreissena polymorpha TaxID=45954 RepID=A0A9D4BSM4_DREPO|nr:hypothetical protein DPMN_067195 [Dreissena polymorpha]
MQDCQNTLKTIVYSHFSLGPKPDYKLNIYGYASDKVLPDDFSANNGRPFATIDKQDEHACALHMRAGWWYNFCSNTLPTGKYYQPCGPYTPPGQYYDGLYYTDWRGRDYSLKFFKMELSVE